MLAKVAAGQSTLPIIAVVTDASSNGLVYPSIETLPLFTTMLPSLIRSLDCGFDYLVIIGFSTDDEYYSTQKVRFILWPHSIHYCAYIPLLLVLCYDIESRRSPRLVSARSKPLVVGPRP